MRTQLIATVLLMEQNLEIICFGNSYQNQNQNQISSKTQNEKPTYKALTCMNHVWLEVLIIAAMNSIQMKDMSVEFRNILFSFIKRKKKRMNR